MNDIEYFDKFVEERGEYKAYPDDEYKRILKMSGITSEPGNIKILDAGCGSGAFAFHLSNYGFKAVGIDHSPKLIETATAKYPGIEFVAGDMASTPFKDNSFNVIFCGASLHHIPRKIYECAKEFYRILMPGGKVYFFEPYVFCINSFLWYVVLNCGRTPDEKALSPGKLEKDFLKAGFVDFSFKIISNVKHLYFKEHSFPGKIKVVLRKFITRNIFPNRFLMGRFSK